jgi:hypothetical protein
MNDEMIPPAARDTTPPAPGEEFRHGSTLPPFASDERVTLLEHQHGEVMETLRQILTSIAKLADRVTAFHEDMRRGDERMNRLAARVALLDGKREGTNGKSDA